MTTPPSHKRQRREAGSFDQTHLQRGKEDEVVVRTAAQSVAGRPLPALPDNHNNNNESSSSTKTGSLLLFYQYKEPEWTPAEHKQVLKQVMALAEQYNVKGRGRVAQEGLNCTLSCVSPQGLRQFCQALRDQVAVPLFEETDFKITDGVPTEQLFGQLSLRKTNELVAYGLAGPQKAPSLKHFAGTHLEATQYHQALRDPETVVIDVRNRYESAVGHLQPPPGGATLVDPNMRHSMEFPKWLAQPETQQKLHNKKVLMYCTGGIRCERATALLNQMTAANDEGDNDDDKKDDKKKNKDSSTFKPKGVYHMRGGIERYVKTYPQGGFWVGKNYLFDKRAEQVPGQKSLGQVEAETAQLEGATCCLCLLPWSHYQGKKKYTCQGSLSEAAQSTTGKTICGVPVLVCQSCRVQQERQQNNKNNNKSSAVLLCELCRQGNTKALEAAVPDLVGMKRKAEERVARLEQEQQHEKTDGSAATENAPDGNASIIPDRLFVSRLPLTVNKKRLEQCLNQYLSSAKDDDKNGDHAKIKVIHWLTDRRTGGFYGSAMVQLSSATASETIAKQATQQKFVLDKKRIKIVMARRNKCVWNDDDSDKKTKDSWPPPNYQERDYPPVGHFMQQ